MESLLATFHVDVRLLVAQTINFAIVFVVLYFFVFKPLSKVMQDRTAKIAKSMEDAKKIEKKLIATEEDYKNKLAEAKKEANIIMEKAAELAEEKKQVIIARAKEEIGQVINQEKAKIQQEKAQTLKEIKQEIADLVVAAMEKILEKKMDSKEDRELIKRTIKQ